MKNSASSIHSSSSNTDIELEVKSPMASDATNGDSAAAAAYRDTVLTKKQIAVPWVKKTHTFDPWFLKADGKIAKYDMGGLHVWRVSSKCADLYDSFLTTFCHEIGIVFRIAYNFGRYGHLVSSLLSDSYLFYNNGSYLLFRKLSFRKHQ